MTQNKRGIMEQEVFWWSTWPLWFHSILLSCILWNIINVYWMFSSKSVWLFHLNIFAPKKLKRNYFKRYVKICHNHLYAKLFTRNRTLIYCAICWLIGCLIDIPNFTGWSRHAFDLDTLNCMWDRLASESYSM